MKVFDSGATRDSDDGKLDFEGFLSPLVLHAYAIYMHNNRHTPLGYRASDNWQLGMDKEHCRKSLIRHTFQAWGAWRGTPIEVKEGEGAPSELVALCGVMFNSIALINELLKEAKNPNVPEEQVDKQEGFCDAAEEGDCDCCIGGCDIGHDDFAELFEDKDHAIREAVGEGIDYDPWDWYDYPEDDDVWRDIEDEEAWGNA